MINKKNTKGYCKDPISQIENYEAAVADKSQAWVCHHRLEIDENGKTIYSVRELKQMNMYYHRPAEELIFLTPLEHAQIHLIGENNPNFGKSFSDKTKKKISEAKYGQTHSRETKKKMSENSAAPRLAKEYNTYKENGGDLTYNAWSHERKLKLQEQWKKYRDEGGTLGFPKWQKEFILK